jgi:hypothetical protein
VRGHPQRIVLKRGTAAGKAAVCPASEPLIETLRPRVAEREVASAISTEARPFARSSVVGSEVGTQLKGLDRQLKELRTKKMGLYAPLLPLAGRLLKLG